MSCASCASRRVCVVVVSFSRLGPIGNTKFGHTPSVRRVKRCEVFVTGEERTARKQKKSPNRTRKDKIRQNPKSAARGKGDGEFVVRAARTQRRRDEYVRPEKVHEQPHGGFRDLDPQPEVVVRVPAEHRGVVLGDPQVFLSPPRRLRRDLRRLRRRVAEVVGQALEPGHGVRAAVRGGAKLQKATHHPPRHVAHGHQDEHRRAREPLVARDVVLDSHAFPRKPRRARVRLRVRRLRIRRLRIRPERTVRLETGASLALLAFLRVPRRLLRFSAAEQRLVVLRDASARARHVRHRVEQVRVHHLVAFLLPERRAVGERHVRVGVQERVERRLPRGRVRRGGGGGRGGRGASLLRLDGCLSALRLARASLDALERVSRAFRARRERRRVADRVPPRLDLRGQVPGPRVCRGACMRDDVPEKRVAFFFVRRVRVFARSAVKLPVAAACRALFGRALRASKRFIDTGDV